MRHIITKAQAIKYAIYLIALMFIITIFPLRLWHENVITKGNEHAAGSVCVSGADVALQQFAAEYDHIDKIGVYLEGEYFDDSLTMRVFDENFTMLREETVMVKADAKTPYADVYINLDTEVGKTYYYTIEGTGTEFMVAIEMTANSGATNNGYLQYAGENRDAYNIMTRYTYSQPLRKFISLGIMVAIALAAFGIGYAVDRLSDSNKSLCDLVTPKWILQKIGNPLVVLFAVISLVCILPLHMFSIFVADLIVMSMGVILLSIALLYLINRDNSSAEYDFIDNFIDNWQNYAQSLFIALAIMECVNYMNGLYEIFHDIAWRKMAIYLGLSLIVTFKRKELFNIYNFILLIISSILARVYYVRNLAEMTDEYHVESLLMTCLLVPIATILGAYIIRCIVQMVRKAMGKEVDMLTLSTIGKGISIPYALMTLLVAIAMIVKRNTRYWPVMMAIVFGVIAVRVLFWDKRECFIANIGNGVLMHFVGSVLYCMWHRPYEAFTYTRYPFVFHTVTTTACYMSIVFAIALVRLFVQYDKTRRIRDCVPQMLMFGAVISYTLFTMSRTGMIAIVATGLVCWVFLISGKKGRAKAMLVSAVTVIIATLWCFPICFSLQKAVPGLVGEPKLMIIESYPEEVLVSKDLQSDAYVTFGRFCEVFCAKMFNIPEHAVKINKYTIYGVKEESKEMLMLDEDGNFIDSEGNIIDADVSLAPAINDSTPDALKYAFKVSALRPVHMEGNVLYKDFVPPVEYEGEDEPPAEWWDEDYWFVDPSTGEYHFAFWMVSAEEENSDVSNGRMDIYRAYIEQLTPEGHEGMGAILQDGSEAAHAHDIYLQVAYDNGIIVGALFTLWVFATCIQALIVFIRRRKMDSAAGIVLAVSVTYAVAGITEWISHPCNPVGFVFLLVIIPMALLGREKAE